MNGYRTSSEKALNGNGLLAMNNGNDPHLVIYRYCEIEYRSGYDEAMRYPEFAAYLKKLKQTLYRLEKAITDYYCPVWPRTNLPA